MNIKDNFSGFKIILLAVVVIPSLANSQFIDPELNFITHEPRPTIIKLDIEASAIQGPNTKYREFLFGGHSKKLSDKTDANRDLRSLFEKDCAELEAEVQHVYDSKLGVDRFETARRVGIRYVKFGANTYNKQFYCGVDFLLKEDLVFKKRKVNFKGKDKKDQCEKERKRLYDHPLFVELSPCKKRGGLFRKKSYQLSFLEILRDPGE